MLVTDAMAAIGTDMTIVHAQRPHHLIARTGRLDACRRHAAGADLDMISAVSLQCIGRSVSELGEALRMASLYPAEVLGIGQAGRLGSFAKGAAANIVALSAKLDVAGVWIDGKRVFSAR